MNRSVVVPIALWFWVVFAVLAAGLVTFAAVSLMREKSREWGLESGVLVGHLACAGFLFCALITVEHPLAALWSWRGLAVLAVVLGLFNAGRIFAAQRAEFVDWLATLGASVLAIVVLSGSLLFPIPASTGAGPVLAAAQNVTDPLLRIDFWHAATLGVLGCGTLLFGFLFIGALQRQGLLWFESHSGGLGGLLGGWRVSSTIGYLFATVLFGAMFGGMMAHEENLLKSRVATSGLPGASGAAQIQGQAPATTPATDAKPAGASDPGHTGGAGSTTSGQSQKGGPALHADQSSR